MTTSVCSIEGCDRGGKLRRGWCKRHYDRFHRLGDPLAAVRLQGDDVARFESKIDRTDPGGCWLWTDTLDRNGYGKFFVAGETVYAHRWSYEHYVGPIPTNDEAGFIVHLDHLCRVRHCVNPQHLEVVSLQENTARGATATKTHCVNGHAFDEPNTLVKRDGSRQCRACHRERQRARYHRSRGLLNVGGEVGADVR